MSDQPTVTGYRDRKGTGIGTTTTEIGTTTTTERVTAIVGQDVEETRREEG